MILSAKINDSLAAQFELNFTANSWTLPHNAAKWGGVMFSERGLFELRPNGTLYLLDAVGNAKKGCTVILHDAPTEEKDMVHDSGGGRVYAPAKLEYKDAELQWKVLQRSGAPELVVAKSSGFLTPVRLKAKSICEGLLPAPGKLTNGTKPDGSTGTGCGEFPGRVMKRIPVLGPPSRDAFSIDTKKAGKLYLTSPTTHWEEMALAIDEKHNPVKKTWVPFTGANRPKTGDVYLLSNFTKSTEFQHVGMIISSEGDQWVTADGGQGNGWQSGFITRKFHSNGQIDGEFGNKAWLKGWVDLDNLKECLAKYFPSTL